MHTFFLLAMQGMDDTEIFPLCIWTDEGFKYCFRDWRGNKNYHCHLCKRPTLYVVCVRRAYPYSPKENMNCVQCTLQFSPLLNPGYGVIQNVDVPKEIKKFESITHDYRDQEPSAEQLEKALSEWQQTLSIGIQNNSRIFY